MLQQRFTLNDGSKPLLHVVRSASRTYESLTIQISQVLHYYVDMVPHYRYVYEELNKEDMVVYARYMGEEHLREQYSWFFTDNKGGE